MTTPRTPPSHPKVMWSPWSAITRSSSPQPRSRLGRPSFLRRMERRGRSRGMELEAPSSRVKGQWVRVSNAAGGFGGAGRAVVQQVTVPTIPGGPILLSVSPGGSVATLFGITYPDGRQPVPHLYVGRFDGVAVSDPREIEIPPGALEGPMGWVGENAFLLAPGPGKAMLVRTDGSKVEVVARGIEDPCGELSTRIGCTPDGPRLLGTSADGSLLFWQISAERTSAPPGPPILVLYYRTWLDGTHGVRLGGLVGRVGPPVAPR